jgi:hypothetical protein
MGCASCARDWPRVVPGIVCQTGRMPSSFLLLPVSPAPAEAALGHTHRSLARKLSLFCGIKLKEFKRLCKTLKHQHKTLNSFSHSAVTADRYAHGPSRSVRTITADQYEHAHSRSVHTRSQPISTHSHSRSVSTGHSRSVRRRSQLSTGGQTQPISTHVPTTNQYARGRIRSVRFASVRSSV